MIEAIREDIECSLRGKCLWENMKRKYDIDQEWLIIIFHPGYKEINDSVIEKLPDYLKRKYITKVLAITDENDRLNEIKTQIFIQERLTKAGIEEILKYYRLVQFSKNIVVTAIEEPYGNWGIIGKADITLEDYIDHAILV